MKKYENECVGCPSSMGCIGIGCPYIDVPRFYCDACGRENAEYSIEGEDYCKECANNFLNEVFSDLSISEKAEALGITISEPE